MRNEELEVRVGKRLRKRRRLLGFTQQQLGGLIGLKFQQIQRYECGANRVSATTLWLLSQALEVPMEYFFADEEPPEEVLNVKKLVRAVLSLNEHGLKNIMRFFEQITNNDAA